MMDEPSPPLPAPASPPLPPPASPLPSPSAPPPRKRHTARNWLLGCGTTAVVLLVALYALIAYGFTHGDDPHSHPPDIIAETYSQAPAIAETGTGSADPPHLVFRISEPHDSMLTIEFLSGHFLWVPTSATPPIESSQRAPTAWYRLGQAGEETVQWTLIAQAPAAIPGIGTHNEIPGGACPAQLPVPLTAAVQNCVIATATIYVGVT